jgi:hypothetical protein
MVLHSQLRLFSWMSEPTVTPPVKIRIARGRQDSGKGWVCAHEPILYIRPPRTPVEPQKSLRRVSTQFVGPEPYTQRRCEPMDEVSQPATAPPRRRGGRRRPHPRPLRAKPRVRSQFRAESQSSFESKSRTHDGRRKASARSPRSEPVVAERDGRTPRSPRKPRPPTATADGHVSVGGHLAVVCQPRVGCGWYQKTEVTLHPFKFESADILLRAKETRPLSCSWTCWPRPPHFCVASPTST